MNLFIISLAGWAGVVVADKFAYQGNLMVGGKGGESVADEAWLVFNYLGR